jgi:hypothetical protein
LYLLKSQRVYKLCEIYGYKKGRTKKYLPSSTYFVLIWSTEWKKIRIRNNHPGSATLIVIVSFSFWIQRNRGKIQTALNATIFTVFPPELQQCKGPKHRLLEG